MNFEQMSDEELKAFISGPSIQAATERKAVETARPPVDNTMGMSGGELALAGAGRELMQIPRGLQELGIGAFGSPKELEAFNREKADQQKIDEQLMSNWQAKAGGMGTQALQAAIVPPRLGAQVGFEAVKGALSPTRGPVGEGVLGQIPTRAMQGAEAGVATAAIGVPLGAVGKKIGALANQFTPENAGMIEAGRAARRQGIIPTTGNMTPGAGSRGIEAGSSWYPEHVSDQANIFNRAAGQEVPVASSVLGQTTSRNIPGEALRESVTKAGDKMREQGSRMWNDLDDYIVSNNLPAVVARDTQTTLKNIAQSYSPASARGGANLRNNEIFQYVERVDDANSAVTNRLRNMVTSKNVAAPSFSELHEMQSIVGKALSRARYDAGARNAPRSADDAVRELGTLYRSISNDVDNWATTNPTAGQMFQQAKGYWRDTVVPSVLNNDLYQKSARGSLGSSNRGYDEPRQFFADIVNKPEQAKSLYATMDQKGRDLITSLHLLPDMSASVTNPKLQSVRAANPKTGALMETGIRAPESAGGGLTSTSRTLAGVKPALWQTVLGHLPFAKNLSTSEGHQKFRLANNVLRDSPLGRASWAVVQKPEQDLQDKISRLRLGDQ